VSTSFREDWKIGTALLVMIIGVGILGAVLVLLFTNATPAQDDQIDLPHLVITSATTGGVSNKEAVIAAAEQAMLEHVQRLVLTALSLPDVEGAKRLETGLRRAKDRDATMRDIIERVYK
jgi:hypothetical protein